MSQEIEFIIDKLNVELEKLDVLIDEKNDQSSEVQKLQNRLKILEEKFSNNESSNEINSLKEYVDNIDITELENDLSILSKETEKQKQRIDENLSFNIKTRDDLQEINRTVADFNLREELFNNKLSTIISTLTNEINTIRTGNINNSKSIVEIQKSIKEYKLKLEKYNRTNYWKPITAIFLILSFVFLLIVRYENQISNLFYQIIEFIQYQINK